MNLQKEIMVGLAAICIGISSPGCATFKNEKIEKSCSTVTRADKLDSLESLSGEKKRRTLFNLARAVAYLHTRSVDEMNCYQDLNYHYEARNRSVCDQSGQEFDPKKCGFVVIRCSEEDNLCEQVIYLPRPHPQSTYGTYKIK